MKALLLLLALPATLAAQSVDAGTFRLYQGGLEVGRETFRDTGDTLETNVIIPIIRARIAATVVRRGGRPVRMDERIFVLPADTLARSYTAVLEGDSVSVTMVRPAGAPHWKRVAGLDAFGPDQSIAAFVALVQGAARRDGVFQVWLPGADSALSFTVSFTGDSVPTTIGPQIVRFFLGPDGRVRTAEFPTSRVRYERHVAGEMPPLPGLTPPKADYSAAADAAYTADSVRVPVTGLQGDTFSLGCTFTKPKTGGPRFPVVITLTGSGQQDRDENLWPLVPAYRLYRQVAERLAAEGIAVLRCDDRGVFQSGGTLDSTTSMRDFAADARAQLAWLRRRADVDSTRLGIIGHSEGGITGPMVAADDRGLRALVIMAGTSKPMGQVLRDQFLYAAEQAQGLTPAQREAARAQAIVDADAFGANAPGYMGFARAYDPAATARRVRTPTLILQGRVDRQVSFGQADTLAAAMRAGGNRDVTVRIFDNLNHLFLVSPSGSGAPDEYATIRDTALPAAVLDTLAGWLRQHLR